MNKVKKGQEDATKQWRKNVKAFTTDNKRKAWTTNDPKQPSKRNKKVAAPKAKAAAIEATPKGERKVPKVGDSHGCIHSGLLELLPLERKYLQTYMNERGWLDEATCFNCNKNEGERNHGSFSN